MCQEEVNKGLVVLLFKQLDTTASFVYTGNSRGDIRPWLPAAFGHSEVLDSSGLMSSPLQVGCSQTDVHMEQNSLHDGFGKHELLLIQVPFDLLQTEKA